MDPLIIVVSLIAPLIPELVKLARDLMQERHERRGRFFEERIDPIFREMERIHKDYEDSLNELMRRMARREMLPEELTSWLEDRSRNLRSKRDDVRNFDQELRVSDFYRAVRDEGTSEEEQILGQALYEFSKAVIEYFYGATEVYHLSWYSDFINWLRALRALTLPEQVDRQTIINTFYASPEVVDTEKYLDDVIRIYLPKNWDRVSLSYRKVKGLCHA